MTNNGISEAETIRIFEVGEIVVATVDLIELADDGFPAMLYATAGEKLIVRKINDDPIFPVSVSHANITDRCFGVRTGEIKLAPVEVLIGAEIGRSSVATGNTTAAKAEPCMQN